MHNSQSDKQQNSQQSPQNYVLENQLKNQNNIRNSDCIKDQKIEKKISQLIKNNNNDSFLTLGNKSFMDSKQGSLIYCEDDSNEYNITDQIQQLQQIEQISQKNDMDKQYNSYNDLILISNQIENNNLKQQNQQSNENSQ
ncbi:hypothetical protein PPERSA_12220 [Pseudocohnilembus persalinus]|uniref:Uncharacterized protein n=1 Tax=Pseudocohnilembus persalinus TaxID=266149 RepID=A0A0V0R9E4_PSEPJ|nr:hypothetical protein PPERSA_12220 [Pseudocohnilembus persalinus]|eukprot:KRX10869.1 hypothetical protein PPERSA_12220 [Pseudocohnilembus persalinus]